MVRIIGGDDAVDAGEESQVLLEVLVALAVGVDVLPCRRPVERELIRPGADDVAVVAVVELFEPMRQTAVERCASYRELCRGGELGPREFAEGVEVDVVDRNNNEVEQSLGAVRS